MSRGCLNPALALAQICWQNLTYSYEQSTDQSYWTAEYALSYIMGPTLGAFMAGNVYNYQRRLKNKMDLGLVDESISDGPRFVTRQSATRGSERRSRKDVSDEMAFSDRKGNDEAGAETDRPMTAQN